MTKFIFRDNHDNNAYIDISYEVIFTEKQSRYRDDEVIRRAWNYIETALADVIREYGAEKVDVNGITNQLSYRINRDALKDPIVSEAVKEIHVSLLGFTDEEGKDKFIGLLIPVKRTDEEIEFIKSLRED